MAVLGVLIGLATFGLAYAAQLNDQSITAALVAISGVILIGALLGLRAGVAAGLIASLLYNLLFTGPFLRLSVSSADDLVPVLALNLSAIASGLIAGRLHDRAVAAETLNWRVGQLLHFSEDLQRAVTLAHLEEIVSTYFEKNGGRTRLFVEREDRLIAADESVSKQVESRAHDAWSSLLPEMRFGEGRALTLKNADRRIGVIMVEGAAPGDFRIFLPLLSLAIERCMLAEKLVDADVIKRSEQFKTALLSSVSHDLRTPLAAITASASSLTTFSAALDEETKIDLLATIQEQCRRLDRLTGNLLNLGKIEGGLDVKHMSIVDAVEVLGTVLSRVRRLNSTHLFERQFQSSSASVRADEVLLEQLFLNLLENAVVHTPEGTPIRVTACTQGALLTVGVEDDGPGIPVEERDRVFRRFYQGRPSGAGSGLGLSIAKGFAEIIGGTIRAGRAEEPLRGAKIEVLLPVTSTI